MRLDEIDDAGLRDLVARFYGRARLDPLLGPVFESAIQDWPPHLQAITDFWSSAMLGTGRYRGNPLAAHAQHPIQPPMFDRWLQLWAETAAEVFAPEPAARLVARADQIAQSLKLALFYRPGEGRGPVAPTLG